MNIISQMTYEDFCKQIDKLEQENDINGLYLYSQNHKKQYELLTQTVDRDILDKYISNAIDKIEYKLLWCKITPMDLKTPPRMRAPYVYYFRGLDCISRKTPKQAYELAIDVLDAVYKNENITNKHEFDDPYFIQLIWSYEKQNKLPTQTKHPEHFTGKHQPIGWRQGVSLMAAYAFADGNWEDD